MKYFFPILAFFLTSCDSTQPHLSPEEKLEAKQLQNEIINELRSEREAQQSLPQSQDPIWIKLAASQVSFDSKSGFYSLEPSDEVKAMQGQIIEVRGFIVPLDGSEMTQHFLIGVNTPVCLFHTPGEPNQVIEVTTLKPVKWTTEKEIKVRGKLLRANDQEMGVFFKLDAARQV